MSHSPLDVGWHGGQLVDYRGDEIAWYWPEKGRLEIEIYDCVHETRDDVIDWDHAREITAAWFRPRDEVAEDGFYYI